MCFCGEQTSRTPHTILPPPPSLLLLRVLRGPSTCARAYIRVCVLGVCITATYAMCASAAVCACVGGWVRSIARCTPVTVKYTRERARPTVCLCVGRGARGMRNGRRPRYRPPPPPPPPPPSSSRARCVRTYAAAHYVRRGRWSSPHRRRRRHRVTRQCARRLLRRNTAFWGVVERGCTALSEPLTRTVPDLTVMERGGGG